MPTYPYACTECDHRFEQVQAFSDASLTECPVCGGRLRKVFSSVGIVFKGSGFYRNDSRATASSTADSGGSSSSESGGSSSGDSGSSSSGSGDSGSGGGDAKPAEKKTTEKPAASSSGSSGSSSSGGSSSGTATKTSA